MRTVLILLAFACPTVAVAAEQAAGRLVAERECGACHAVGMRGESQLVDAPRFRDLRGRIDGRILSELLTERRLDGHPRMPRPSLDPDELAALVAYWDSLPSPERAAAHITSF